LDGKVPASQIFGDLGSTGWLHWDIDIQWAVLYAQNCMMLIFVWYIGMRISSAEYIMLSPTQLTLKSLFQLVYLPLSYIEHYPYVSFGLSETGSGLLRFSRGNENSFYFFCLELSYRSLKKLTSIFSIALQFAFCAVSLANGPYSIRSLPWYVYFLGFAFVLVIIPVQELVKMHDLKEFTRFQKRSKLEFSTKVRKRANI
jgi:hypothetical protein